MLKGSISGFNRNLGYPIDRFGLSTSARKRVEYVFGTPLNVSAPEETILQKLRWVRETGGSEKAYHDALRVYEVQLPVLDLKYIDDWIERLALRDLWDRLRPQAEEA